MFTRIYDWRSEEQPSQPLGAADLFFSCPLSYKDVGFFFCARSEDVSTTILPRPPPLPKTFPGWRRSPIRDGCGVMDHRASGPCGELHPFNTNNNNNVWTTNSALPIIPQCRQATRRVTKRFVFPEYNSTNYCMLMSSQRVMFLGGVMILQKNSAQNNLIIQHKYRYYPLRLLVLHKL